MYAENHVRDSRASRKTLDKMYFKFVKINKENKKGRKESFISRQKKKNANHLFALLYFPIVSEVYI